MTYRPDSFILMLRYCANLKAIRYESMSLNRIAAKKIVAQHCQGISFLVRTILCLFIFINQRCLHLISAFCCLYSINHQTKIPTYLGLGQLNMNASR